MVIIRKKVKHNLLLGFGQQETLNRWRRSQVMKPLVNLLLRFYDKVA
jgi:hypothetical protein